MEDELESNKYLYSNGQSIRLRKYYRKQLWERYTGTETPSGNIINGNNYGEGHVGANINELYNSYASAGDFIWFYAYYERSGSTWVKRKDLDNNSVAPSYNIDYSGVFTESQLSGISGTEGDILRVKLYFQKRTDDDYLWEECYPTSSDLSGKVIYDGAEVGATYGSLAGNIGAPGAYLFFNMYYTKSDTRSWTNERTSEPEGATFTDATFDYAFRDNHKAGYKNGEWVKMPNYDYYRLDQEGDATWVEVPFTDGSTFALSQVKSSVETLDNGNTIGQYAAKGTKKVAAGNVPDYSQMSFKYWKQTLTTATTSKHANTSIPNEVFQECKHLTTVNYLAGNVTGFLDHTTGNGYAQNLSVTIGKDVTQIDNSAFQRCDGLTNLTFDTDYTTFVDGDGNPTSGCGYPKELTIGDYAFQDCKYLMNVTIPNRVVSIGNSAFEHAGNKTQSNVGDESTGDFILTFERRNRTLDGTVSINFDRNLVIGDNCFDQCYNLKTLSLPIRLSSLGSGAFTDTKNLTSLTIREEETEDARITTIPRDAFLRSGIRSVKIPRSVTEIQSGAFQECFDIETITFQQTNKVDGDGKQLPLIIRGTAFAGGTESEYKLKKVNVEISPSVRLLVCEYNAFNFTSLVGQTDVVSNQEAVLNFKDEDWDYYQGNWKKGYAFSQSNLNLFKDGIDRNSTDIPTVENDGLVKRLKSEPQNGWQQFAMSTLDKEFVIPEGNYIRTYSTATPHYIPIIAGSGTYLYDIFRISAFSDGYVYGDDIYSSAKADAADRVATATKVTDAISDRQYVPANTGLIMQIHGNSNDSYIVYQDEVPSASQNYASGYKEYTYPKNNYDDVNLLWPSCVDATVSIKEDEKTIYKVVINPTDPYPIGALTGDKYRIFGLWVEDNAFWRSEPDVLINTDMAYLKLRIDQFHWANEDSGTSPTYPSSGSRIALVFANEDSETSAVSSPVITKESDDCYYTIQGVKLSHPLGRGMYIHNGKKIFVK